MFSSAFLASSVTFRTNLSAASTAASLLSARSASDRALRSAWDDSSSSCRENRTPEVFWYVSPALSLWDAISLKSEEH